MSIGHFCPPPEAKRDGDRATSLILPILEPWIPRELDELLKQHCPAPRHFDLLSPSRMLRFELLHAAGAGSSFRETFREVWQTWLLAGCVRQNFPVPSALVHARSRLPLWALKRLLAHTAQAAEQTGPHPVWPAHRLLSIDSTPLDLPNTPSHHSQFGTTRSQHGDAYFPKALGVWVLRLHSLTVAAEYLGTSREGDESVAPRLLPAVLQPGDLLLGDAHFGNYPTLSVVQAARAFYLVRAPGPLQVQQHVTASHGAEDVDLILKRSAYVSKRYPDLTLPEQFALRAVAFQIPLRDFANGTERVWFLTNLPRTQYSREGLAPLPPLRWNHETLNNDIKSRLALGVIRSLAPEGAYREILAHLCLANLVRLTLCQHRCPEGSPGSFTATLSAIRQANQQLRTAPQQDALIQAVLHRMILDQPLCSRPGRTEPRMTRPRRRPYPIFKTSRADWKLQRKQLLEGRCKPQTAPDFTLTVAAS